MQTEKDNKMKNDEDFEVDDFVESVIGMSDEEFETAVNDLYYREDENY